jgi:hypothetical protein
MRWYVLLGILVIFTPLALPLSAYACPACSAALAENSSVNSEDKERELLAYNNNIYLMVGTPYLLLAGFGLLVYRGLRQNAAVEQQPSDPHQDGDGGLSSCPPPSTAEDS